MLASPATQRRTKEEGVGMRKRVAAGSRRMRARIGLLVAVVSLIVASLAGPANAGVIGCTTNAVSGNLPGYPNCMTDSVGYCTVAFDPLIPGNDPVLATIVYADCLA
jgi:hypothetical protein